MGLLRTLTILVKVILWGLKYWHVCWKNKNPTQETFLFGRNHCEHLSVQTSVPTQVFLPQLRFVTFLLQCSDVLLSKSWYRNVLTVCVLDGREIYECFLQFSARVLDGWEMCECFHQFSESVGRIWEKNWSKCQCELHPLHWCLLQVFSVCLSFHSFSPLKKKRVCYDCLTRFHLILKIKVYNDHEWVINTPNDDELSKLFVRMSPWIQVRTWTLKLWSVGGMLKGIAKEEAPGVLLIVLNKIKDILPGAVESIYGS